MTYIESLKSGHIAVWNESVCAINTQEMIRDNLNLCKNNKITYHKAFALTNSSDIHAVNIINRMIDSVRDL